MKKGKPTRSVCKQFLRSVWDDVGQSVQQLIQALAASIVVSIPLLAVVLLTAWGLSKATGRTMEEAADAAIPLLFLLAFTVGGIGYLINKYKEAKADVQREKEYHEKRETLKKIQ